MSYVMVNCWQGPLQSVDDTWSHSKGLAGPLQKVLSWTLMGCPWGCSKAKCWWCWILVSAAGPLERARNATTYIRMSIGTNLKCCPMMLDSLLTDAGPLWSVQLFHHCIGALLCCSLLVSRYRKRLYLCLKWHCRPRLQTDQFWKDLGDWENLFDPS